MNTSAYSWMMLAAIAITLVFWWRIANRDKRLVIVYASALVGALLGAKAVYFLAEGWMVLDLPDKWLRLATGKSILGALIGGYAAVEIAKKALNHRQTTGDWFAIIAPFGISLGRLGCLLHGCCLGRPCEKSWFSLNDPSGVPRWPAAPVELMFNLLMPLLFVFCRRQRLLTGQQFHVYLIAYGAFRLVHEFYRETPRWVGPISGYHVVALAVCVFGIIRFQQRRVLILGSSQVATLGHAKA